MEENRSISPEKLEANRRNAQLSTGPKTEEGKSQSRRNALKHGVLSAVLLVTKGESAENPAEFQELMGELWRDLAPVGTLEAILVEKIAVCWWRQRRALMSEAGLVRREFTPAPGHPLGIRLGPSPGHELDRILRYETAIQRQLAYAINQLERLQRARKGEHVSAPVSVQVSSDR